MRRALIPFFWHLHYCLASDVPLEKALVLFYNQLGFSRLKKFIAGLIESQKAGFLLSEAVQRGPKVPNQTLIAVLLSSAEKTGSYERAFKELAQYQTWSVDLTARLMQILLYPLFLIILSLILLSGALFFLVPQLHPVLQEMSPTASSPLETIYCVVVFLQNWGLVVLGCFALFTGFVVSGYLGSFSFRVWLQRLLFRLPGIGPLLRTSEMAYFGTLTAILLHQDINLLPILQLHAHRHPLFSLRQMYQKMADQLALGSSLSETMQGNPFFSELMVLMIHAGEKSGNLAEGIKIAGDFFNADFHRRVEVFLKLLPASIIFLVGSVFIFLLIQIILPLYDVIAEGGWG